MKLPPYDPFSTYQSLGRIHRSGSQKVVINVKPIEELIAERLREKLKANDLPVLSIWDETVIVKGPEKVMLLPCQYEALQKTLIRHFQETENCVVILPSAVTATGKSLHLDKKKKAGSL